MSDQDLVTVAEAEAAIRAALHSPGLSLVRVAEVKGKYAATFEARPHESYAKYFGTDWYPSLSDLLGMVIDTLQHINGDQDVNIYSAQMFEYLSAEMFPGGKPISLTVTEVKEETVSGPRGEQVKVTLSFKERPKKLILNKTNARALAKVVTPETDNWIGATVVLGVEPIKVGKNTVPSIRVKSVSPANKGQRAAASGAGQSNAVAGAGQIDQGGGPADQGSA